MFCFQNSFHLHGTMILSRTRQIYLNTCTEVRVYITVDYTLGEGTFTNRIVQECCVFFSVVEHNIYDAIAFYHC